MHRRMVARTAVVAVLISAGAGLAGCSGSSPRTSSAGASGSASGSTTTSGSTKTSGHAPAASTPSRGNKDPRAALPVVKTDAVAGVRYSPATAADRKHFAKVAKASGGLTVSSAVHGLSVGGTPVGAVAVYRTKPGLSSSATFQDQYVVQLINAVVGKTTRPKFVRANGQVMALTTGGTAVAGWFEGDHVVLVYRDGRTPDLASLAAGVKATTQGR